MKWVNLPALLILILHCAPASVVCSVLVGWCELKERGGRRAMASRLGSENFGRGTDPETRVEGVACKNNTGHSRYLYLRLYEQSNPTYGFQAQICLEVNS
mgnify:CR=1 FL=1